jgi:hypothetical protein
MDFGCGNIYISRDGGSNPLQICKVPSVVIVLKTFYKICLTQFLSNMSVGEHRLFAKHPRRAGCITFKKISPKNVLKIIGQNRIELFLVGLLRGPRETRFPCMYDVIYEVEIALCNINKDTLQLNFNAF